MTTRRLRHLLRMLRRDHPTNRPVRVHRVDLQVREWGDCDLLARGYQIRINRRLHAIVQEIALFHEWAHALTWSVSGDHGALFAEKFASLIRWYQEEAEYEA